MKVEGLKIYFESPKGFVRAVDDASLEVERGEIVGLVGESGSGKSTLGLGIMRLIYPPGRIMGGRVLFEGRDILSLPMDEFVRNYRWKKIAMVFQASMNSFSPTFKIRDQFFETLKVHGYQGDYWERTRELLQLVSLDPTIAEKYPHELSGGQKQRAFIALALAMKPKFLIADEPTTALDVVTQVQILKLFKRLRDEEGITIMFITHDIALLSMIADRIYVMYAGKIVEGGPLESVVKTPAHPYTRALMEAVPTLDKDRVVGIPGSMPSLVNPPKGCRFEPRCPVKMSVCAEKEPPMLKAGENHYAACWKLQTN
ncbi:MAG: ABC transporter ATP-binding protein [Thermoprotei archaeon]